MYIPYRPIDDIMNSPPAQQCCDNGVSVTDTDTDTDYIQCRLVGSADNPVWVWDQCRNGGSCIERISVTSSGTSYGSDYCDNDSDY